MHVKMKLEAAQFCGHATTIYAFAMARHEALSVAGGKRPVSDTLRSFRVASDVTPPPPLPPRKFRIAQCSRP